MFDRWRVPVSRLRDGDVERDQYGEPISQPVPVVLPPGLFAPDGLGVAAGAGESATLSDPAVYWPREFPDVKSGDRLVVDGSEWRVNGRPAKWPLGFVVFLSGAHTNVEAT